MSELIVYLVAWPFVALAEWFSFIKQHRYPELVKACHGAGMIALVADTIWHLGGLVAFTARFVGDPANFLWVIPAGMVAWGVGWFLLNARYAALSMAHERPTMIVRALLKIVLGFAMWAFAGVLTSLNHAVVAAAVHVVAVWLLATGITKLGLMLWGRKRGQAEPMVQKDIERQEFDWDDGVVR